MDKKVKYVIIGNGIAGLNAATAIRKIDAHGKLLMISSEEYLTYYRLKLSHILGSHPDDNSLLLHNESWYKEQQIEVKLSSIVEAIHPQEHTLILDDGSIIQYEKCLLATGSKPFVPPVEGKYKQGVFAVRTLKDIHYMEQYFAMCELITVVGGGILGLEAAASLINSGKTVQVIEFFPYLLPRQLDESLSSRFEASLKEKGMGIFTGEEVDEILGDSEVEGIRLKSGTALKTDAVIFSSGIRPSSEMAIAAGLKVNKGVVVDNYSRTSHPDIFAAGDVAEFEGVSFGLWSASTEQGRIAGQNMAGKPTEYHLGTNHTQTTIMGISLFSAGDVQRPDDIVEEESTDGTTIYKLYIKDGKIRGGVIYGDISKLVKMKKLIELSISLDEARKKGDSVLEMLS